MMKQILNNLFIVLFIFLLCILGYRLYENNKENERLNQELIGKEDEYRQLNENTAKLAVIYKDQKDLLDKSKKEWEEISKSQNERIKLLSDATYLIRKNITSQNSSDYIYVTPKGTQNYVYNEVRLEGEDSPPIGFVIVKSSGEVYKGNYKFEIQVKNVQIEDEKTGEIKVYSKAFIILKEKGLASKNRCKGCKDWENIEYPLKIVGGEISVDPTKENNSPSKFHLWNPKLLGSINLSANNMKILPGIQISLSSYGPTRNDSSFKFMSIGTTLSKSKEDIILFIKPISWKFCNILSNTYLSPGVGYGKSGLNYIFGLDVEF